MNVLFFITWCYLLARSFEVRLEMRIANVQHLAEIFRKWDANYETKLLSKTPLDVALAAAH